MRREWGEWGQAAESPLGTAANTSSEMTGTWQWGQASHAGRVCDLLLQRGMAGWALSLVTYFWRVNLLSRPGRGGVRASFNATGPRVVTQGRFRIDSP